MACGNIGFAAKRWWFRFVPGEPDVILRRIPHWAVLLSWLWVVPSLLAAEPVFPPELVQWTSASQNPVFTAGGEGTWDVAIRERGFLLREDDGYHMWYTGYDGTREGLKMLGYATSPDGIHWQRHPGNPVYRAHWVEDMMVVRQGNTYYMFAEGKDDQSHLLTSRDRIHWTRQGPLDIRLTTGKPIEPGPYGTPVGWYEEGTWYLFYERRDLGVWLATSCDMQVWRNVQDDPVMRPGPEKYDRDLIAMNQILKYRGRYYATYHGTASEPKPNLWAPALATSTDLIHWTKYPGNPLQPIEANRSSNILVPEGDRFRMYTMHGRVELFLHHDASQ